MSDLAIEAIPSEVRTFIAGADLATLHRLNSLVVDSINAERAQSNARAFAALSVGDRVKIGETCRDRQLRGAAATVVEKRRSRVVIDLDEPHGKWFRGIVCPADMLDLD